MSFVSAEFLLFFAVTIPLYFLTPFRFRWVLLLIASYIFYIYWNANYIILIVFSTLVDYLAARAIHATDAQNLIRRRALLSLSLMVNLGVLFTFKYFNFFSDSFAVLVGSDPFMLDVLLPVGISFYTFQSMSYTIDVYRGMIAPEKHFGIFATFIAFFPQLVAGPIERAGNMLPQFYEKHRLDYGRIVDGLRLILWGAFKKMVIADRVAYYVNAVYAQPEQYSGTVLMMATVFFAFQIYCDFSGYSDIAIGTAKIMGFDLMQNFRQPYLSRSIREFWRRWHISLSTWFRDYLYIPLGGNRVPFGRMLLNLMIVFVVSGLWHGANWTFVVWGALHGGFIVIETILTRNRPRDARNPWWMSAFSLVFTFVLVNIAWIFFRAESIEQAWYVLTHLLSFNAPITDILQPFEGALLGAQGEFIVSMGVILVLMVFDGIDARWNAMRFIGRRYWLIRWAFYYVLGFGVAFSLIYGIGSSEFIYFQF